MIVPASPNAHATPCGREKYLPLPCSPKRLALVQSPGNSIALVHATTTRCADLPANFVTFRAPTVFAHVFRTLLPGCVCEVSRLRPLDQTADNACALCATH